MTNDKTVLVTGASRGIGFAFVQFYQNSGWNVIATARNPGNADKLKALEPYKIVQLDTADEASILAAAKQLEDEPIDLLINNAGIGVFDKIETASEASLLHTFETNAIGSFLVTRAFLPNLRAAAAKNGSATVGQISSTLGSITESSGQNYAYRVSKAALNMVNACLGHELKKDGVIAVTLCPGSVSTDLNKGGVLTTEESVSGVAKVLDSMTLADSGSFRNNRGDTVAW